MDKAIRVFVGLDVHKDSIEVALAQGSGGPGRAVGRIAHDVPKLLKLLKPLGLPVMTKVVYEAGPTGYGLQRELSRRGYRCEVIAPSLIPRRSGDRVKTDKRDAKRLAELSRAGELKAIWIPDPQDEAIRDVSRAREDAVQARTRARHQLKGFLLRHGLRFTGKSAWTRSFYRWLSDLSFPEAGSQTALTEYQLALEAADQRVERLSLGLQGSIKGWRFEALVFDLCALRGIALLSAIGLVAEIGDIARFAHPRQLMGYLGLVPSERSSGDRTHKGPITKAGNAHARRLLTEAAWNYRFKPRIGREARQRQEALSEPIRAMAWKAQLRLSERFTRLRARGVQINKVCVATARELAGFIWAIAQASTAQIQGKG